MSNKDIGQKRILGHLTDQELSSKTIQEIVDEYFVSRSTVNKEFLTRGIKPQQKTFNFNVSKQDLKELTFTEIARREKTTVARLYTFVYQTYGIKQKEVRKMYDAHQKELRRVDILTDDELRKPISYLIKVYGATSKAIKEERLKRGLNLGCNRFKLTHVTDEELFGLSSAEACIKFGVSYDTISREKQKRKKAIDPNFKKRPRNVLKNVSNEELFGTLVRVTAEKYGVSHATVCKERKTRRKNGRV